MRVHSSATVKNQHRIFCVSPHYNPAFGTFNHAYRLMKGVRAFMPLQGLLLIAAYMPQEWPVRFIDENMRKASDADLAWADAVLVSGMHVQAPQIHDIAARAHAAGKVVLLGGPSPSASPEMYPEIDYLHIGELGDATDQLIARLDESVARPAAQLRLETKDRVPLHDFPIPAYDLIPLKNYLRLMRDCAFLGIFVGIETPEADALRAMRKSQNVAVPMMESIKTLNDYGLEVTSGIILGLDTDSDDTEMRIKDFIDISQIPMLTINLLQALPKTPLWDRLKAAERIESDPSLESNVRFLRPYDEVVSMWRR